MGVVSGRRGGGCKPICAGYQTQDLGAKLRKIVQPRHAIKIYVSAGDGFQGHGADAGVRTL